MLSLVQYCTVLYIIYTYILYSTVTRVVHSEITIHCHARCTVHAYSAAQRGERVCILACFAASLYLKFSRVDLTTLTVSLCEDYDYEKLGLVGVRSTASPLPCSSAPCSSAPLSFSPASWQIGLNANLTL